MEVAWYRYDNRHTFFLVIVLEAVDVYVKARVCNQDEDSYSLSVSRREQNKKTVNNK